eukprot:snap_masked-scaffold_79-processed-gene-0.28-mRNA-1 protein AED:0.27 eAED:0.27 QI:0/0/0/0.33/1/1/3/0/290
MNANTRNKVDPFTSISCTEPSLIISQIQGVVQEYTLNGYLSSDVWEPTDLIPVPTISVPDGNPTIAPVLFSRSPTEKPTANPTRSPTNFPTSRPTDSPTLFPTARPTGSPTLFPTSFPTRDPAPFPTRKPTSSPTRFPTVLRTDSPSVSPTLTPSFLPTESPNTPNPTVFPTNFPHFAPRPGNRPDEGFGSGNKVGDEDEELPFWIWFVLVGFGLCVLVIGTIRRKQKSNEKSAQIFGDRAVPMSAKIVQSTMRRPKRGARIVKFNVNEFERNSERKRADDLLTSCPVEL